jgi:hypothetical protein
MHRYIFGLLAIMVLLGLAGCLPAPPPELPEFTPVATPSISPSPTIVWFPPTATFTPMPSPTHNSSFPTSETRAQHGDLIFIDNFDNPEKWTSGRTTAGSVVFGKGELSLGVAQPKGYLYSLRQETDLSDFYLEITASPSICRDEDEYGVLFRISQTLDFFRFGLNCSGEARLDRFVSGVATSPQPPILSGSVPPGAPSSSQIGIWASNSEMRFYVNGEYLFTIRDSTLKSGGLGVYGRAAGDDAITINFSNLIVYQSQP